jgi:FkbM family methyltransferase
MDIRNEYGEYIDIEKFEKWQQDLVRQYILEDDVVLELGARYGSVSCIINSKLNNKSNHIAVEPDYRVWNALEENKKRNNCNFNTVQGFVSKKKLDITNLHCYYGYGTTFYENQYSKIPCYTLDEVRNFYNIHNFTTLVADCEGFLEIFLHENPDLYDNLRLIIYQADYPEKCNYDKIRIDLYNRGFLCLLHAGENVWIKTPKINYYVIHCKEHTDRYDYTHFISTWLEKPVEIVDGVYSKCVGLSDSEPIEYMKTFNNQFRMDESYDFKFFFPGQIGCYLSHFKIIEKIAENRFENLNVNDYSVIFEDDVSFDKNLHEELEKIIWNLEYLSVDAGIIYLGNESKNKGNHLVDNIYYLDNTNPCFGTYGLLFKNRNIQKLYYSLLNVRDEIDSQYKKLVNENIISGFVLSPPLCTHRYQFNSNINTK